MRRYGLVLMAVFLVVSCAGKKGPTGPQGAQGDQGATGPQGQAGPQGPQGNPGSLPIFWDDFESGTIASPPWTLSGDANWTVVSDAVGSVYGSKYITSGTIIDGQSSKLSIRGNFVEGGLASFFVAVGSETSKDWLWWRVDGTIIDGVSGNVDGQASPWLTYFFPIPPGTHTIEWSYTKDNANSESADRAWMDGVMIMNYRPAAKLAPPEALPAGVVLWSDYIKTHPN